MKLSIEIIYKDGLWYHCEDINFDENKVTNEYIQITNLNSCIKHRKKDVESFRISYYRGGK